MPTIDIPEIKIPKIDIPLINSNINDPFQVLNVPMPSLMMPGCVRYHRDASPKNTVLYDDDPTGTIVLCPYGSMPSFEPLLYDRRKIEIVETKEEQQSQAEEVQPVKETTKPKIPKEDEETFIKCPGDKDQRVGDFRNEKRLERVKGHVLSEDKSECITLYENVSFKDQYLPEFSTVISTAAIATVAAVTPLLLSAVKPLVKQLIKRIAKIFEGRKNKVR